MLTKSPTATWMPAWVPESTLILSFFLMFCSMVQSAVSTLLFSGFLMLTSQTNGYDGSMMNGLNILPSYTNYFNLNPATTGLNTASVFIGGFFGPIFSGVISDRLGRRPAIFWGSVITLVGVLLQTAAQDIAMFVVARIVLGFGSALSGIAGGVYLSETFPSQWRAWGVGMLNNFY
jgi:MFS family permease